MTTVRERLREQLVAATAVADDREYAARVLADVPSAAVPGELRRDERLRTAGALSAVLDRATDELLRDLTVARELIDTVLEGARALLPGDAAAVLRGRALRLQAWAVREQGAVAEARALLARAQTILAATPAGAIEREHARLQEAYILNEMGKHGQALGLVQKAAASYAALGDAKGTLEALLAEAAIHFEADDFELAQTVYEKALPLAKSVRNARGCALALGHLGHCAMRLGHTQRALAYFAEALPLYDTLGMSRNRRSILWEMARLAVREDRLADAFRQFASVREDFLRRGMFMSAAFVALDMAELLLEIGRAEGARQWCQELVQTFSSAGMPEYALQALRHLKDAAENDMLDVQVLGRVRADVCEHLHSYA